MTRPRIGLFGLCAVVLGLMAISASAAQASQWLILNASKVVKTGTELPALLGGEFEEGADGTLLTTVLGVKTEILCTTFLPINAKLEGSGTITNGFQAKFTGCRTFLNGEFNEECLPKTNGGPFDIIETLELKGQLKLIGTLGLVKIEPKVGTTFVVIELGSGCPIGKKLPVAGVLTIEECKGTLETHLAKHLIIENTANTALTALGNKATLDGSAFVFLTGVHAGLLWGGDKE